MMKIGPSILGVSDEKIVSVTNELLNAGCDFIHYDVMDGKFVTNTSFSIDHFKFLKANIDNKDVFFDVHLMTFDLEKHIKEYAQAKANNITFHYETSKTVERKFRNEHLVIHLYYKGCDEQSTAKSMSYLFFARHAIKFP